MGSGPSRERIFGISNEDHLLYSPALLDLEHGTIRHRDKEMVEVGKENEIRQGYFYHTRLPDWTDDSSIKEFQKKVVVKGGETNADKMFYVYGMGADADTEDNGIVRVKPKPKGLGYRWRGNSEHQYFRLRFSKIRETEESDSEAEEIQGYQTVYRLHPKAGLTARDISDTLSLKQVIPPDRIHIIYKTDRLEPDELIELLSPHFGKSKLEIKMMTDVEIVKYDYDAHEFEEPEIPAEGSQKSMVSSNHSAATGKSSSEKLANESQSLASRENEKSDILSEKSDILSENSDILSEKSNILSEKSGILSEKSESGVEKSESGVEKSASVTEKSANERGDLGSRDGSPTALT